MKKLTLIAALLSLFSVVAPSAHAETTIGVIDARKILEESNAGKALATQLKARQQKIQATATEYDKKLKATEQEILAKRKDMKQEELLAKKKEFEAQFIKNRNDILSQSADLDSARKKAVDELQKGLAKATADVADEKKLSIVVDRQFVILAKDDMDVTKEVMTKMNDTVKSVTLGSK